MAKVLGKSGRYVIQTAARRRSHQLLLALGVIGLMGFLEGLCVSNLWSLLSPPRWLSQAMFYGGTGLIFVITRWALRKLNDLESERRNWKRGAEGETLVGRILGDLPEDYYVINDLSTPSGNLDHVVVGPTGVFVVDAKNWRGVVEADGKGELLVNGKRTDQAYIRRYVGRIMGVKDSLRRLAGRADPYFRGLFVFTAARVEAVWGKTGSVHCLRDDQLRDYIVELEGGKRLNPEEVQRLAQAFLGLAHIDRDFADQMTQGAKGTSVIARLPQTAKAV